jgi:UDP-glucose:(heptosyl)LPS alpha-1,3-glucosyltransferase
MSKIAVVIPKYGLVGGAEQFVAELTGRLAAQGNNDFHVFANRWQEGIERIHFHKVPIISFPKFFTSLSFAFFVQHQMASKHFNLVHSHERIFAADIYTLHGVPHRFWISQVRRKRMSLYDLATAWVEKKLVMEGNCKKFVAVSNLTKEIFLNEYPIDPQRVAVIHPGVDFADYPDKNTARVQIRKEYGLPPETLLIIFASMNFEIKGLDAIIAALARLKHEGRDYRLVVAGKGNERKYRQMAAQASLDDRVIFTGTVKKEKLIRLYLAGDLYMMLSQFDTFGMVVLEAMAAGLPVIISSNVGAKDIVQEGKNGFIIYDTADADYISSKINILFDENIRSVMARKAIDTARQNTWEMVATKYQDIYANILDALIPQY